MNILPFGDRALLINWPQQIEAEINNAVHAWKQAIETAEIKGFSYAIPAYCSLTIVYNPLIISFEALKQKLLNLEVATSNERQRKRTIEIPVVYDGIDLPEVAEQTGLSEAEIIKLHSDRPYLVYMIGFLPGFPYLGALPDLLHCPRKRVPRQMVPSGAVGLAGAQTGIYPFEAPGGWQIIGRTKTQVFDAKAASPFLLQPGDRVIFRKA